MIFAELCRIKGIFLVFKEKKSNIPLPATLSGQIFCPFLKFFLKNRLRFDTLIPNK